MSGSKWKASERMAAAKSQKKKKGKKPGKDNKIDNKIEKDRKKQYTGNGNSHNRVYSY